MVGQKTSKTLAIETMNTGAAAVDIRSREHLAAVIPDVTHALVRAFSTFTHDLADRFKSHGVTSVAMESTGVYWIPAYEFLKQCGVEVILVNARYATTFPGERRTSTMPVGCDSCIHMDFCEVAFDHLLRFPVPRQRPPNRPGRRPRHCLRYRH